MFVHCLLTFNLCAGASRSSLDLAAAWPLALLMDLLYPLGRPVRLNQSADRDLGAAALTVSQSA